MTTVRVLDGPYVGQVISLNYGEITPWDRVNQLIGEWPGKQSKSRAAVIARARYGRLVRLPVHELMIYWIVNGEDWHAYTMETFISGGCGLRYRDTFGPPKGKTLCINYYGEH